MKVVLCEKSSAAKDIAAGLSKKYHTKSTRNADGFITVGEYQIVWAAGHLIELNIEKSFGDRSQYPSFPQNWVYQAASGSSSMDAAKRKLLKNMTKALKTASEVIIATDCGREGELIARLIINHVKIPKTPIKRFWTSEALEEDIVISVFNSLDNGSEYESLYQEALARQQADALVGINLSRALKEISKARGSVSLGRVQSPVLNILVKRELEIQNFKPEKFWTLQGEFGDKTGSYLGKWKRQQKNTSTKADNASKYRLSEKEANELEKKLRAAKTGTIQEISKRKKVEKPPLLHSITTMQIAMNKKFGISAKETDAALQSLYEKHKASSYPRTESKHLGEKNGNLVRSVLKSLGRHDLAAKVDERNRRVFDSSKLTDHHALIPTRAIDTSKLNSIEQKVYAELVASLSAAFYPDAISEIFTVTTDVAGEKFESKGTQDLQAGWKEVYNIRQKNFSFELKKGTEVPLLKLTKDENWTKPPSRFTEATLLEVLENAHLLIPKEMREEREIMKTKENAGLGTGATRSGIIQGLLAPSRAYATTVKSGKTVFLVPTQKGISLIQSLPKESKITNALLTAELEQQLKSIREKKLTRDAFISEIKNIVNSETTAFKATNFSKFQKQSDSVSAATGSKKLRTECPECKKALIDIGSGVKCENCKLVIWKKFLGKKLSTSQLQKMLTGKAVLVRKLKSKAGKVFDAYIIYDKNNKRLSCDFNTKVPTTKTTAATRSTSSKSKQRPKKVTSSKASSYQKSKTTRRL